MKYIGQGIVTLSVFANRYKTILFSLYAYLDIIILSGFRKVFDHDRMRSRFECQFRPILLLSIDINLIILDAFHLECSLGIGLALESKSQEMKGITIVHVRKDFAIESGSLVHLSQIERRIQQVLHGKCLGIHIHTIHHIRLLNGIRSRISERLNIHIFGRCQHTGTKHTGQEYLFLHDSIRFCFPQR